MRRRDRYAQRGQRRSETQQGADTRIETRPAKTKPG
jgi:hypothetical protein